MIEYDTILSLPFLKKSRFTGSERGMRFVVKMIQKDDISRLEARVCPGPYSVDCTKEELFLSKEFPFTDEGRREAVDWMNEEYRRRFEFYEDVYAHPSRYHKEHHKEQ